MDLTVVGLEERNGFWTFSSDTTTLDRLGSGGNNGSFTVATEFVFV